MRMSADLKASLAALSDTIRRNPKAAKAVFRADTRSSVDGFATRSAVRQFAMPLDEPRELGGTDTAPNPVEAVLAALGSCQAIVYRAYASVLGVRIESVYVEAKGHLDLRGLLGMADVPAGLDHVTFSTRIVSPEPAERIRELATIVESHCPVLDTLRRPLAVRRRGRTRRARRGVAEERLTLDLAVAVPGARSGRY